MTDQDRSNDRDPNGDPRTADEQDSPAPERPPTIQEQENQSRRLDDPPKAEGNREDVEEDQDDT